MLSLAHCTKSYFRKWDITSVNRVLLVSMIFVKCIKCQILTFDTFLFKGLHFIRKNKKIPIFSSFRRSISNMFENFDFYIFPYKWVSTLVLSIYQKHNIYFFTIQKHLKEKNNNIPMSATCNPICRNLSKSIYFMLWKAVSVH